MFARGILATTMTEQSAEIDRKPLTAPLIALVAGVALLVASFVWPHLAMGGGEWTKELASQHQNAAAKLHGLTHKYSDDSSAIEGGAVPDDLRRAQNEFFDL